MKKKKSRLFSTLAMFASMALLVGCSPPQKTIDAEAIDPLVTIVANRHDAYVASDASLSAEDKATYLRSTAILRGLMDTAMGRQLTPPVEPDAPADTAAEEVDNGAVPVT